MKILALLFFLVPALVHAQAYQSPATVAKQLKAHCAGVAPQQRKDCEEKSRGEVSASIAKHHDFKRAEATGLQASKSRARPPKPAVQPPAAPKGG